MPTDILKIIKQFRRSADTLIKQIEAKRYPAIAEQRPTARRARIAAGMAEEADWLENLQSKLNALADHFEAGTVPESLMGIRTKKQVEYLAREIHLETKYKRPAEFPRFKLEEHADWVKKKIEDELKLLRTAGIDTPAKFEQAIQDLRMLGKPIAKEPTKKQLLAAKERELIGRKISGFFTTPKSIAERMVDLAEIEPGMTVLEPSAGKGNIADIIRDKAKDADLSIIEPIQDLREILEIKGYKLIGHDFLEHTGKYDRIIQNPPFEKFQDIDHVRHAYKLLKPEGRLISIMSESPFFRSDKKAVEFRGWLEEVGGYSEKLPDGVFKKEATATGVASRLIIIDKSIN